MGSLTGVLGVVAGYGRLGVGTSGGVAWAAAAVVGVSGSASTAVNRVSPAAVLQVARGWAVAVGSGASLAVVFLVTRGRVCSLGGDMAAVRWSHQEGLGLHLVQADLFDSLFYLLDLSLNSLYPTSDINVASLVLENTHEVRISIL